ncbi:lectin-like domain-containing protein [Levilactobacillus zymae]|uniref:WxL domain-containing protein n=1 Tax=Levilactobacillus zymae TaxID=267363 RepID=UPI0028B64742|nr:WxL domain-containing protein [Levilactobacillus zymae]MDT6979676.1 WxL domain-containing protein [Levilactobacillus zymae]
MLKRWFCVGVLVACMVGLAGGLQAHADTDFDQALATAPQGISLNKANSIIALGTAPMSKATVEDTTNPDTPGTQAVVVNTAPYQFGTAWSTDENSIDLTHNQSIGFWFYFGNQGIDAGDGMAFVLQNDPRGLAATPDYADRPIGETLGVWAVDTDPDQAYVSEFAKTAIQNSWALEFDTHYNGLSGKSALGTANAFDIGEPAVHIASNYPGSGDTYDKRTVSGGLFGKDHYYYSMHHNGVIADNNQPNFLSNGRWHHMTLKWDATAKTMTYTFNDRNPKTGVAQQGASQTVPIDLDKVDPDHTGHARWGFTGTTGQDYENNLIVLDNTPGLVDGTAEASLQDLTHNHAITQNDQVISGDRIELDYKLHYNGGRQAWSNINSRLNLPEGITYQSAEIDYAKGPTQTLNLDDIKDSKLSMTLDQSLDQENDTATVKLIGQANQVNETVYNREKPNTFSSNALVTNADTPAFAINPSVDLNLTVTSTNPVTLQTKEDTTVTGKVDVITTAATKPSVNVQATLNGQALPDTAVASDGTFTLPLTADQLQMGTNTLRLTAATPHGDTSLVKTVRITVVGTLAFGNVDATSSFVTSTLTGDDQLLARNDDWAIAVKDTRGTGQHWALNAQSTAFTDETGHRLAGGPVYVGRYGTQPLTDQAVQIMTHTTNDSVDDGQVNVANSWGARSGVLLNVDGGATAGTYQGTITWTLANAPS